jgi:predicted RNA binding protein YcfA (HicA-like mRNA interferase family)
MKAPIMNGGTGPITDRKFFVPRHDSQEMRKGTAEAILKQAGIK